MAETVRLVFAGEILAGFDPVDVMARVAHALKVDEVRMAHLFSGTPVVLRRGVEVERARRYAIQFARMGARLHLEPDSASNGAADSAADAGRGRRRRRRARMPAPALPIWGLGQGGRLGRQPYVAAGSVAVAVMTLAAAFVVQQPSALRLAVGAAMWLVATLLSLRWTVLRLHDIDRPPRWALLVAVPALGVLAGLAIASLPGTKGANAHGDEPRRGRWWLTLLLVTAVGLTTGALLWAMKTYMAPLHAQLRGQAAAVFDGHYAQSSTHKAFAFSPGGAWGWRSGLPSRGAAVYEALANCEQHRKPDKPRCQVIDIDGAPPRPDD